jgi:hypothetical protein
MIEGGANPEALAVSGHTATFTPVNDLQATLLMVCAVAGAYLDFQDGY